MLCKLSLSNIKKSFKDYAIYFITLILGVCIFYIFNSMDSQTAMLTLNSRQLEMTNLLTEVLSYVSVFVSFILGFLIIYASRFLIKKRNKEFGIYMTLGMSKRKISVILLIETLIIGLISLIVGLALGIMLSQVTSVFVARLFEANMEKFAFNFSKAAMIKTVIYFGIIYLIVMVFNTIIISKNKLINLLNASKKSETIKIKNPYICVILFIISVVMLGYAYYMVTGGVNELIKHDVSILLKPVGLGIVGTIILFYSISGMLLKVISKCKNIYYKKLNTFTFKGISSRVNTMVISMSVICIMLFITLCVLSSVFTIRNFLNGSINKYAPVDFELVGYYSNGNEKVDLVSFIENDEVLKNNTKDIEVAYMYIDNDFTYDDSLGNYRDDYAKARENYMGRNTLVSIMGETDYNKLAKLYNMDTVNINSDEYAIVVNYQPEIYQEVIARNSIIKIFNKDLKPTKVVDGFYIIGGNATNDGFFVVDDSLLSHDNIRSQIITGNYKDTTEDTIELMEKKIDDYTPNHSIMKQTKEEIKDSSTGLSMIITFLGLYLGIIFLISSSAILSLKELSDCIDDKSKYKILRQIGADEKEINKALFKQSLIFFMMPLAIAIVHTVFGLKFCNYLLSNMGIANMLDGVIMTLTFLIVIYGIYFIATYLCSKNIIRERV